MSVPLACFRLSRFIPAILLFVVACFPALAAEEKVDAAELVAEMRARPVDSIWEPAGELIHLAAGNQRKAISSQLENLLKDDDEKIRVGAAHVLCQLNETSRALKTLCQLVSKSSDVTVRRAAIAVIRSSPIPDDDLATPESLKKAARKERDAEVRLGVAEALYQMGYRSDSAELLGRLLNDETSECRDEAALALARQGWLRPENEWTGQPDEELCRKVLQRVTALRVEPTPQGRRAADLFREMTEDRARVGDAKLVRGERLMRELLLRVLTAYPDKSKCDIDHLFEQAGKGLMVSLDPFCQYLDEEEVLATQEMLRQDYGGIGAYVGLRDQAFMILQPVYNAPAYRAGLRALDTILEVDGHKTTDAMQKGGLTEVISKLKGRPGSTVRVKFFRRGFAKPVEVDIVRDVVHIQSVYAAMLPGRVGYIRLTRFGEQSDDEMGEALKELTERQGAQGLILDLRDNPGGLLRAAVDIADRFLSGGKLIVYSEGRESFAPRKDFRSSGGMSDEQLPMVVLVNGGTASASEIVSGCLQDQHRATLIGEKTFGKGSVQQIIPLRSTDGKTQIRLTVAKYYLPSGRCIHELGVDPDISAAPEETDDYLLRRLFELRRQHVFEDYARKCWEEHGRALLPVIEDDDGKTDGYPGFEAWLAGLSEPPLPAEAVRREVRAVLRRLAQDELEREFTCDLSTDEVLQRGVFELLRKMNVEPASFAQYRHLPDKFKETAKPEHGLTALPQEEQQPVTDLPGP